MNEDILAKVARAKKVMQLDIMSRKTGPPDDIWRDGVSFGLALAIQALEEEGL